MTAEETLRKYLHSLRLFTVTGVLKTEVLAAMTDYANQKQREVAVAFARYISVIETVDPELYECSSIETIFDVWLLTIKTEIK